MASTKRRPSYVSGGVEPQVYSAYYHTDVLVPFAVTSCEVSRQRPRIWTQLSLDYIDAAIVGSGHLDFGLFHGLRVSKDALYYNPWDPVVVNARRPQDY